MNDPIEKEKKDCIKVTIIVPCQRCGSNQYVEIQKANKYTHLSELVLKHTEMDRIEAFGHSRLLCKACQSEYHRLIDRRKEDVFCFLTDQ